MRIQVTKQKKERHRRGLDGILSKERYYSKKPLQTQL